MSWSRWQSDMSPGERGRRMRGVKGGEEGVDLGEEVGEEGGEGEGLEVVVEGIVT